MSSNQSLIIKNINVYAEDQVFPNGYIKIVNGKIVEIGTDVSNQLKNEETEIIKFTPAYNLIPGAIDMHIHGVNGADTMDATEKALNIITATLPQEGTTSFLATTMTQSKKAIEDALENAAHYIVKKQTVGQAEILGIHLEGPFISPKRAGAQPTNHIIEPNIDLFKQWQSLAKGTIKQVTLAPEEGEGIDFINYLHDTNVVASIGHTDATYQEVDQAIKAGATQVTHLYNGMRGLHHREPGILGAALLRDELFAEMIVDGIHAVPEMIQLAYKMKTSKRVILITDSMRAKCLKNGVYDLGGQEVIVNGEKATLANGSLAGSILKMKDAMKNMLSFSKCTLQDVIQMAAVNPAKQLSVFDRKGSLAVGKDADFVILDENYDVVMTFCRGKLAYKKSEQRQV
ncbi:N-acetylglucosamine-6-phosphate deacetylase [Bacillus sp. 03113]|uniref:N-acetylglucosamine-6-phosphate deacetylase n=1 Tax=Bacillus sp. 03113 TaxID=2578211 RepID=UPI0011426DC5|nr:N-acetylglucosamine-6-phosphate deacetylase [Bacillus sp. 03113]